MGDGGPSFLALVHHPDLPLSVSTWFHIVHHRGLSHERPIKAPSPWGQGHATPLSYMEKVSYGPPTFVWSPHM